MVMQNHLRINQLGGNSAAVSAAVSAATAHTLNQSADFLTEEFFGLAAV